MKLLFLGLLILVNTSLVFSQNLAHSNSQIHKVVVKEVLQTSSYTYLEVAENEKITWLAVPKMDAEPNDIYYYQGGMEMRDFRSKELDTVFYSLMFISAIFDEKIIHADNKGDASSSNEKNTAITPVIGGITISELKSNPNEYNTKTVKLKGRVTKFSSNIMGLNWIHLEDGSGSEDENDITITSKEVTNVGDIITIEGNIILDKDFGYGYFYNVLMENGKIIE